MILRLKLPSIGCARSVIASISIGCGRSAIISHFVELPNWGWRHLSSFGSWVSAKGSSRRTLLSAFAKLLFHLWNRRFLFLLYFYRSIAKYASDDVSIAAARSYASAGYRSHILLVPTLQSEFTNRPGILFGRKGECSSVLRSYHWNNFRASQYEYNWLQFY